jgi:hypothetical protein
MSTSPETQRRRADDELVTLISAWLVRQVSDEELHLELGRLGGIDLQPAQAHAVDELRMELEATDERAEQEMVARETLETLAVAG